MDIANLDKLLMEVAEDLKQIHGERLQSVILFGSYARGDYDEDSDIDIAAIVRDGRRNIQGKIKDTAYATDRYFYDYDADVNVVSIPENEYLERVEWYPFYANIATEGKRVA